MNQIALITGVSRQKGIGAAVARELAQAGFDVFITYFRPYGPRLWPGRSGR